MNDNLDLATLDLIAGTAPAAASAPEAQPDIALDIATAVAQPELSAEPAPRVRKYIPCTGSQITTFLKAANAGMKDAHFASEGEVEAFVKGRGL